ncbi:MULTISPECIES: DUF4105 domain-containing protein [unclassified Ectothiorhodospira]|uniref:Lnb N-terminal periplasmic domain-containing protein n=1 Tax=unclassified Ectothiorhodospira TaxID=2684909 RepID=UPI001EE91292|nr:MULTISPECIES: DUF4105 domain-containing protein [unclassified Ectothiorhodospira]MCG5514673.1 DUF4105 domain-containing protein [Ectothiorhodospira sp. 9100]MCG5517953.1 DUF4105 domain-containing protein [Ectothiorhodospira sp. 9905]
MTGERWPQAECPEWEEWQQEYAGAQVGVMFASGYLGNPASFFGHLMLHLEQGNPDLGATLTRLLDTSLNFGADVPEDEGLVTYMAKGLLGGYEARYSRAPFYRNTALYSEREMRDLWHYRLALPTAELELLVAHLFEVIGQDFEYLFLTENCASRIARTLELVVDDDLTPGYAPWVAPETLVRAIAEAEIAGRPLLGSIQYVPSRRLQTEWRYQALTVDEQATARAVWPQVDTLDLRSKSYLQLPPARQAAILDTLLGHAAFLKQTGDDPGMAELNRQLLQARLQLPVGSDPLEHDDPVPLHEATPPALVRVEGIYNDEMGGFARLTLRPLQYDLLDSNATRMPYAALEIGRTEFDIGHDGRHLRRLEFFNITNLHARSIRLPALPSVVWHASSGLERTRLDCNGCLDAHVMLSAGKSYRLGRHLPFAMAGGKLRSERHQSGFLVPMAHLGLLSDWTTSQRSLIQVFHAEGFKGEGGRRTHWLFNHRMALGEALDLRAGVEGDGDACEVSIGFSRYF